MTAREKKQMTARRAALAAFLATRPSNPNPETLSRSYGLPVAEVRSAIRSA